MSTSQPPKLELSDVFNALQRHMLAESSHQICFHDAFSEGPGDETDNSASADGARRSSSSCCCSKGPPGWWETVCLLKGILLLQKRMRQKLRRPKRLGSLKRLFSSQEPEQSSDGGRGVRLFQNTMAIDLRLFAFASPSFPSERRVGSFAKPSSKSSRQRGNMAAAREVKRDAGSQWLDPLLSWSERRNGRRAAKLNADPPAVRIRQSNHSREHDEQLDSALEWELHRVAPPWALLPEAEAMLERAPRSGETHRYKCVKETEVFRVIPYNPQRQQPHWPWEPARGKTLRPGDVIFVTDVQILREPASNSGGSQAASSSFGNGKVVALHGNGKYFSVLLAPALYHIAPQAELEQLDELNEHEEDDDDQHGVEDIMRQLAGGAEDNSVHPSSIDANAGAPALSSSKTDNEPNIKLDESQQQPQAPSQKGESAMASTMPGNGREQDVSVEVYFESVCAWESWYVAHAHKQSWRGKCWCATILPWNYSVEYRQGTSRRLFNGNQRVRVRCFCRSIAGPSRWKKKYCDT